tara:strand:- start:4644 stop:5282 length:639 start_codon:yes stop_codon:yes gene_type:complete
MAIGQFSELKTAVANWLADDSLTDRIPEFIAFAEDAMFLDKRLFLNRNLETSTDLTVNAATVATPSGFLAARRLYIDGDPKRRLDYVTPDRFHTMYASSTTDRPEVFTVEGTNFLFAPTPDSSYTGKLLYYAKPSALSADADTNWIFTTARGLYLYGALLQAAPYLKDQSDITVWAVFYDQLMDMLEKADQRFKHSGDTLQIHSDVNRDRIS